MRFWKNENDYLLTGQKKSWAIKVDRWCECENKLKVSVDKFLKGDVDGFLQVESEEDVTSWDDVRRFSVDQGLEIYLEINILIGAFQRQLGSYIATGS